MKQNEIPDIVKAVAKLNGYNSISYCGHIDNSDVYGVGYVSENGDVAPTGLPELIVYNNGEAQIVGGLDAFELLSRLE